jgi:RNA polymerase sigma-70 factor (ECF subfamily)
VVGRPLEESELVERARRGDAAAYEEIVQTYQGIAFRVAYVIAGSAADAEEAAQDGFVKAYRALGRFRPGAPFRPWLLRIVANEARNRRRSIGRRHGLALRAAAMAPHDAVEPGPEASVIAAEARTTMLAALSTLRDEDREVLGARFFLELSEAETAESLGLPRGTVKSRTARALGRLRVALAEADQGAGGSGPAGQGTDGGRPDDPDPAAGRAAGGDR